MRTSSTKILDHKGNEYATIANMCEFYGITLSTYNSRVRSGMTKEQALTREVKKYSKHEKPQTDINGFVVDHRGNIFSSQKEMCRHYNVSYNTFMWRRYHGYSLEECLRPVDVHETMKSTSLKKVNGVITDHKGNQFKTYVELCEFWDINKFTIYRKIKEGYSVKTILEGNAYKNKKHC